MERSLLSDYSVNVQKASKQATSQARQSPLKSQLLKKIELF